MAKLLKLSDSEYAMLKILVEMPVGEYARYTTRGKPCNFKLNGVEVTNDDFNWLAKHQCIAITHGQEAHITLTGFRTFLANARGDDSMQIWEEIKNDRTE